MGKFTGQEESQIGLSRQPTPSLDVPANPQAFGIGVGQAVQQVGQEAAAIATDMRKNAATFASTQEELNFATEAYKREDRFLAEKHLTPVQTIGDYEAEVEQLRGEYAGKLKDPLARKRFEIQTRVFTQGLSRRANDHAIKQIDAWQKDTTEGAWDVAKRFALPTGNKDADLRTLGEANHLFEPTWRTFLNQQHPGAPEKVDAIVHDKQSELVDGMLHGYARDPAGGMRLVNGVFPGTNLSVREVLGPEKTGKWEAHFGKLGEAARAEAETDTAFSAATKLAKDPITGRFNEQAATGYLNQIPPEQRARIRKDFEHRVTQEVHLQAKADTNRIASLYDDARKVGEIDKADPRWLALDEEGQHKVGAALDAYKRDQRIAAAQIRSANAEERRAAADERRARDENDRVIVDSVRDDHPDFRTLAALTDEDLKAQYPGASELGMARVKKIRGQAKVLVEKGQEASGRDFAAQVNAIANKIRSKGGDAWKQRSYDFREKMMDWFSEQEPGVSKDELRKHVGDEVLQYGSEWYQIFTRDQFGFELTDAEKAGRKPLPTEKQPFAAGKTATKRQEKVINVDINGNILPEKK